MHKIPSERGPSPGRVKHSSIILNESIVSRPTATKCPVESSHAQLELSVSLHLQVFPSQLACSMDLATKHVDKEK